jgi:hypothetical protein
MSKHKHYKNMIIAANDTSIEWQYLDIYNVYKDIASAPITVEEWVDHDGIPSWDITVSYRQKQMPHPHQALIDQAKADPTIQWQCLGDVTKVWYNCIPAWGLCRKYRPRPAQHPHQAMINQAEADPSIKWQVWLNDCNCWSDLNEDNKMLPFSTSKYRRKPNPHQQLMDIAAADPSIEWEAKNPEWMSYWGAIEGDKPKWLHHIEYRQKPAELKMVDMPNHDKEGVTMSKDEMTELLKEILKKSLSFDVEKTSEYTGDMNGSGRLYEDIHTLRVMFDNDVIWLVNL